MSVNKYQVLLHLLKGLIYAKRGLFWFFKFVWQGILRVNDGYQRSVGFILYKFFFYTKKFISKHIFFSRKESKLEFFGRRATLQVVLFILVLVIMFPHSRLYSKSYEDVPGRNTLLYSIVGPGNQDFVLEEETVQNVSQSDVSISLWKEGSVSTNIQQGKERGTGLSTELVGVSMGGTALEKPMIMSNIDVGVATEGDSLTHTQRTEVEYYEVQSGDVIGQIANNYGVSIETILWANNLTVRSYIRPGDKLKILPVDGLVHTIAKGDTITKIARKYDAKSEEIISYNKLQEDGADIVMGEELIIPGGVKPQPVVVPQYIAQKPTSFDKVSAPPPSVSAPAGSGYLWPTAASHITQYFSWRHGGLDIAGPKGTAIYATKSGTVVKSECNNAIGYGCYVQLNNGAGVSTIYAHASQLLVSVGDAVEQGQSIALMGSTGRSTGPHLHFEIQVNGKRQNPLAYIRK
ncbi:MAG: M23 family metallopeptidase [Candidatus Magasanikbacteria bacterium]